MKKLLLILLCLPLLFTTCKKEEENITPNNTTLTWEKSFERIGYGNSVQQTTDGGYIVCGSTDGFEGTGDEAFLMKIDQSGNLEWEKTFGTGHARSVQQTTDGGYIICGQKDLDQNHSDVWLIKTDVNGNLQWDKTFDGSVPSPENYSRGNSVQETSDGGYIICGTYMSDRIYIIKTSAIGNTEWKKILTIGVSSYGYSVNLTNDNNYIITGDVQHQFGVDKDVYLIKIDLIGTVQWDTSIGGNFYDWGESVQQTTDDGYIVCGSKDPPGTTLLGELSDIYLIKTDENGTLQWEKTFGTGHARSVQQTSDGGFVITGYSEDDGTFLIKTNLTGDLDWRRIFEYSSGSSVQQTSDGGYIICGAKEEMKVYLIKTDQNGYVNF